MDPMWHYFLWKRIACVTVRGHAVCHLGCESQTHHKSLQIKPIIKAVIKPFICSVSNSVRVFKPAYYVLENHHCSVHTKEKRFPTWSWGKSCFVANAAYLRKFSSWLWIFSCCSPQKHDLLWNVWAEHEPYTGVVSRQTRSSRRFLILLRRGLFQGCSPTVTRKLFVILVCQPRESDVSAVHSENRELALLLRSVLVARLESQLRPGAFQSWNPRTKCEALVRSHSWILVQFCVSLLTVSLTWHFSRALQISMSMWWRNGSKLDLWNKCLVVVHKAKRQRTEPSHGEQNRCPVIRSAGLRTEPSPQPLFQWLGCFLQHTSNGIIT